jgi:hypothetical protein
MSYRHVLRLALVFLQHYWYSRTRRAAVAFADTTHSLYGASVAQSRILQQVQEYAIDIIIHPAQHFDAFRDGGPVFD